MSALAERYAAALADVAVERHLGDAIWRDLNAFGLARAGVQERKSSHSAARYAGFPGDLGANPALNPALNQ